MKEYSLKALTSRGLTKKEADIFYSLLEKINLTDEDLDGFEKEMENGIPFEGGMGFTEALTGLKESMEN